MSWSFTAIGRPDAIAAALEAERHRLTGQSRVEFEAALPHLVGLLNQNFATAGYTQPLIEFNASGSGCATSNPINPTLEPVPVQRECVVTIKRLYCSRLLLEPPAPPEPAPQSQNDSPDPAG